MARAGVILGWIGVAVPAVLFVFLFLAGPVPWWITLAVLVLVILGLSVLVIYTRRNNRR